MWRERHLDDQRDPDRADRFDSINCERCDARILVPDDQPGHRPAEGTGTTPKV